MRLAPLEPAADVLALMRAGLFRPMSPRVMAAAGRRLMRDGMGPQLALRLHALQNPNGIATAYHDRATPWRTFVERVDRLANHLLSRGVAPGSVVGLMMSNRPEFIEAQAAIIALRSTATFIAARAPAEAARAVIDRMKPVVVITDRDDVPSGVPVLRAGDEYEQALAVASDAEPRVDKNAEGKVVVFTSGSTGRPKGAVRSFANAGPRAIAGLLRVVPLRHDDVHLVAAPLYHSTGSGFAQISQILGASLVLIDRFTPEAFCRAVQQWKVTTTAVVPTMLHELISWERARDYDLSSLRVVITTGSALRPNTRERANALLGDVLYDLYGSTEMAWVSVATPRDHRERSGTVGKPVPGVRVKILDPDGKELPRGEAGEIWASNEMMMSEYVGDATLTNERMRDGFVSVRDVGLLDDDGYLHLVDRADDMIISGGVNVYPAETEAVLVEHPAVAEAVVFGLPDEKWGQRLVAAASLRSGTRDDVESALIAWCKERLAPAAVPKEIRVFDALPRSETGKIAKRQIASGW